MNAKKILGVGTLVILSFLMVRILVSRKNKLLTSNPTNISRADSVSNKSPSSRLIGPEVKLQNDKSVTSSKSSSDETYAIPSSMKKKLSRRMHINLKTLWRSSRLWRDLNPSIDFRTLTEDDPRLASLVVPRDTKFYLYRDSSCPSSSIPEFGAPLAGPLDQPLASAQLPSFQAVALSRDTTMGQLSASLESSSCVSRLYLNGSISDAILPAGTKDLSSLTPPELSPPKIFNVDSLNADIRADYANIQKGGGDGKVSVCVVGVPLQGVDPNADPTVPKPTVGFPVPASMAQVMGLPMPVGDKSNQLANLNNSIINAASLGAQYIIVPFVDPSSIAESLAYAQAHGTHVVLVPPHSSFTPTGSIPAKTANGL